MSEIKWYTGVYTMPEQVDVESYYGPDIRYLADDGNVYKESELFTTEKSAILHARQLRVAEVDRLTAEIKQLDERYDQIETAEVIAEAVTEDYMPQVKL